MKRILLLIMALAILTGCATSAEVAALRAHMSEFTRLAVEHESDEQEYFDALNARLTDIEAAGCSCDTGTVAVLTSRAEAAARKCESIWKGKLRKGTR